MGVQSVLNTHTMKTFPAPLALLGFALADTATNIVAAPSEPVAVQDNNLYYNNYAEDPYSQGYYDYSADQSFFAPQQTETDRQDFFDAITPLTVGTVFVAALLGAMVAPALTSPPGVSWTSPSRSRTSR